MNPNIHIFVKLNGAWEKILLFHQIMGALDKDWPWGKKHSATVMGCKHCNSFVWAAPTLAKEDLDKLAAQIDDCRTISGRLKLTVKNWTESMKCVRTHDAMGIRWVPAPLLEMGQINHRPDFSSGQQKGVVIIGQSAASH